MSAVSSGLQTPAFKAFIDIAPEKQVAGFSSDRGHQPIASSGGLKGIVVSFFNSIASAISSTFASHKAEQGTAAHQAFISSLKSEYGTAIGQSVSRRCGLDTALSSGQQLSGQVIQDAFKTAESLNKVAKFEQSVLQNTAFNDSDGFQALCLGQGVNPEGLRRTQRETFDDLVRGSGLINRDTGAVGNKAPNVSLLIAGQELAIRVATFPDTAFDEHIGAAMKSVDKQQEMGEIYSSKATDMRDALVAAGRKMAFATGVHALSVGEFLSDVARSGSGSGSTGQLARDLLVMAKTQGSVFHAMTDIRTAQGKTSEFGADEVAVVSENAFKKALLNLPTGTTARSEMTVISSMAQSPSSALCRAVGVLENIINENTLTSDQNGKSGGVPQRGAASAWSVANVLVGLACKEANLSSEEFIKTAFMTGEGMKTLSPAHTDSVLEHVNQFISS
jgi:hypothetical protein